MSLRCPCVSRGCKFILQTILSNTISTHSQQTMLKLISQDRISALKAILVLIICSYLVGSAIIPSISGAITSTIRVCSSPFIVNRNSFESAQYTIEVDLITNESELGFVDEDINAFRLTACTVEADHDSMEPTPASSRTEPFMATSECKLEAKFPVEPIRSILDTIDYLQVADTTSRLRVYIVSFIFYLLLLLNRRRLILAFLCSLAICFYVARGPIDIISGIFFLVSSIVLIYR